MAVLDQVWYAEFVQGGECWRMGSVNPGWEQQLPLTGMPERSELDRLAGQGVWLAKDAGSAPPLAVMCCGQGSIWPGMGRELYEYFPEARAAMDRLAACTNWDVLALMDEPDVETIGLTQWAQPYLFLLEYAQWSLFAARGLRPACFCGHSLGELIALCLSGVYSPETCWYILETRSRHVAELEARSRRDTGMMGVYAGMAEVAALRESLPDLCISNYNTPEQFILSGPKEVLKEARRLLRKKRIPAVILNIALAFHHPSMRVLRDLDYQRLMMLDMHAASTPMISCVTARDYPQDQPGICSSIMDLDESAVNWVDTVGELWDGRGVRHFLELGPQDTLCGLVGAIRPSAGCVAASSRGRERDAVRQALAQLYVMGCLSHGRIVQCARDWQPLPEAAARPPLKETEAGREAGAESEITGIPELRALLAAACGREAESLRGSMDLRFDLHLRSSCFPSLIEEAQKALGVEATFEELLNVSTVADLERVFRPGQAQDGETERHDPLGSEVERDFLAVCGPAGATHDAGEGGEPSVCPESLRHPARLLPPLRTAAVLGGDDSLCAELVRSLASLNLSFVLPDDLRLTRAAVLAMGSSAAGGDAWRSFAEGASECDVLIWQGPCAAADDGQPLPAMLSGARCSFLVLVERDGEGTRERLESMAASAAAGGASVLGILAASPESFCGPARGPVLGDLLLAALREGVQPAGSGEGGWRVESWLPDGRAGLMEQPMADEADISPLVFPERKPALSRRTACTVWNAQFSPEVFPVLEDYPADGDGWHPLPLSLLLEAHRQAAVLASPGLTAVGFTDIRVQGAAAARRGLVREARMVCDLRPWMLHDRVMVRMCRVRGSLRQMSRGGRSSFVHDDVLESCVLLAGSKPGTEPLWEAGAGETGRALDIGRWYGEKGIGERARFLAGARMSGEHGLEAVLDERAFLALQGVWPYTFTLPDGRESGLPGGGSRHLCALEAVLQACDLARDADAPRTLCETTPGLIGFVRFGAGGADGASYEEVRYEGYGPGGAAI
ncbi:MAG: acyltransferase domain-containing protein, partial [Desulfovibrionaceae bacterium]|nr:acyltransferase domain-containing protein [Desulfovibrionaceae bacterium]